MRASVADGIGGWEGFPKFRVIRAPDVSLWYFFGIRTRIPYDYGTLRGQWFIVSRKFRLERADWIPNTQLKVESRESRFLV